MRIKNAAVLLAAIMISMPLWGQGPVQAGKEGRKKVGLVLSGGGAKGVAHISAIKVLEEAGIPIDYIAGTSMGAIIGGLYAIGYDTHTLDSMVRTQDWNTLIYDRMSREDLSFGAKELDEKYLVTVEIGPGRKVQLPSGIIGGTNIYNLLYELTFGYHDSLDFHKLPIPFTCVGYDMVSGKSVPLCSGSLTECIRASMSIPGAFQTVQMDSMVLVDGGIGNNFPADIVKQMGAEVIIGIDVTAPLRTKDQLNSFADIFDQITSFTAMEAYNRNLEIVDLYVHPDIEGYSAASFSSDAIDTLLNRGERAMYEKWDDIIALKSKIGVGRNYRPQERELIAVNPPIPIDKIKFEGVVRENEKVLRRLIGIRENSVVTGDELRQAVTKLTGTKTLTNVQYRLDGDSIYNVTFSVHERHRNTISAGFRFDTEEMAAILLNARYSTKNMTNAYFDLTGRLGTNPYGRVSFIYGNETQRKFAVSFMLKHSDINIYTHGKKTSNFDYLLSSADMNFSNIRWRNFRIALGIRYDYYAFDSFITGSQTEQVGRSEGLINYYGLIQYESLDSRYYPRKGSSINASYTLTTSNFYEYRGGSPFAALQLDYISALSVSRRVTFLPSIFGRVLIGRNIAYMYDNFMGGPVAGRYVPHQLPFTGLYKIEKFEKTVVGAHLETRVRMWRRNYLSLKASYAKQHDNFFRILEGEDIFGIGVNYSYNSFIGPIDVLVDWSNYDKKLGVYFNLGYYF